MKKIILMKPAKKRGRQSSRQKQIEEIADVFRTWVANLPKRKKE